MKIAKTVSIASYLLIISMFLFAIVQFYSLNTARNMLSQADIERHKRFESIKAETLKLEKEKRLYEKDSLSSTSERLLAEKQYSELSAESIGQIAMQLNVGILKATRNSERRLSKAKAEELLTVLRDELSLPVNIDNVDKSIHSIQSRLIKLTEMLAEAQVSLTDLDHRVVDVEEIVNQLPNILNNHRDNILALKDAINEVSSNSAKKSEVEIIRKEVDTLKWSFGLGFGTILAVMGWLLNRLVIREN